MKKKRYLLKSREKEKVLTSIEVSWKRKGAPVPLTSVLQPNVGRYAHCRAASSGRGVEHSAVLK